MPKQINLRTAVVAVTAMLCAGALSAASAADDVQFPALQSSYLKTGDFIGPDHVRRVRPGLSKDQVRLELGNPHFSEGIFGVSEWDYAFNFHTGKGNEHVSCQWKVKFERVEGQYRVAGTHWKTPDCALLVHPPGVVAGPNSPILLPPQKVALNADGLFRFDGGEPSDLLSEGQKRVTRLAADIQANFKALHYVTVTGHTDRLGTDAYNQALSQARANTVRDLLVQAGIDRAKVRASGMGKRQPVVSDCEGTRATPELVKCLQPNGVSRLRWPVAGKKMHRSLLHYLASQRLPTTVAGASGIAAVHALIEGGYVKANLPSSHSSAAQPPTATVTGFTRLGLRELATSLRSTAADRPDPPT